jgi:hypothetical protein
VSNSGVDGHFPFFLPLSNERCTDTRHLGGGHCILAFVIVMGCSTYFLNSGLR